LADWRRLLAQVASGDLDIAGIGQLAAAQLPLGDHLEPGALEMECLDAPFRRRALIEKSLEDSPADPDGALVGPEDDAELDGVVLVVPSGVFGELKEQHLDLLAERAECSHYVLELRRRQVMAAQGERVAGGFILITGLDGIRYAVRPQSVGIIHDADECRDETLVQLHGGHIVRVPCSLDEVLGWFA
jgi:hypothetical protein